MFDRCGRILAWCLLIGAFIVYMGWGWMVMELLRPNFTIHTVLLILVNVAILILFLLDRAFYRGE